MCAVSDKVHTTRTYSQAILNKQNSQIIAFDTPGVVSKKEMKKFKLDERFVSACRHSIQNSNIIGVIHDASNHYTRGSIDPLILSLLKEYSKVPSFLVMNKIDKLRSKRTLLDLVRTLTCNNLSLSKKKPKNVGDKENESEVIDPNREKESKDEGGWPDFKGVFMVSSLNGDGVEKVVEFIEKYAVEKPWEFKKNETTDQKPTDLIEQLVRARLLDYLPQEIPYSLVPQLEYFSDEDNKIFASVIIKCPNERHERLLCGMGDKKLKQITDRITSDMIQSFKVPVSLTINTVVVKKTQN